MVLCSRSVVSLAYDKRIFNGLPVSNHDHSVSNRVFTRNGGLIFAVGGNANMGLPGSKMWNLWETPMSGGIVFARTSLRTPNENIQYCNTDMHLQAKKTSGNDAVYASGMRNPLAVSITRGGAIYGVNQGPNCKYAFPTAICSEFDSADQAVGR